MLKKSSVSVAKSRLKLLIVSDRISCSPAEYENISEIYSRHYPNIWNLQKITFMLKYTERIFFHFICRRRNVRLPRLTKPYKLRSYKFSLVLLCIALSVIGVMVVGSAKACSEQADFGVCVGFILMMIVSLIDYIWILNFYWIIYAVAILSLLSVLVFGHTANGAKRWIDLGFTTFQPSELAKILLILFFAISYGSQR